MPHRAAAESRTTERSRLQRAFLRAGKRLGYPPLANPAGQIFLDAGEEEWRWYCHHYPAERVREVLAGIEEAS